MNCQTLHEKLIDFVYDELPPAERPAVQRHLAVCGACRAEWEALQFARSALAEGWADEPPSSFDLPATPPARAYRGFRWLPAAAAAAAAVLVGVGVWLFHQGGTSPVLAASGPPVVEQQGISLTILSRPEGWQDMPSLPVDQQREQQVQQRLVQMPVRQFDGQIGWSYGRPVWQGLALVRDRRLVRRLPKGVSEVRFADVPSGILPDTVRLRSLDGVEGLSVLEQSYQYDLASAAAVLQRHVNKEVRAVFRAGGETVGVLLSFDDAGLVIQPPGEGPRTVTRSELQGIAFAELPAGLLTRPTLVWDLANRAASKQPFEVAYLTHGLHWRADYVLKLRPAEPVRNHEDTADLVGYATVTNASGVTYHDAQLKLMAGDVNLIKPPARGRYDELTILSELNADFALAPVMTEKSFFEYHLYTVTRPTTLRDAETKQLEMVSGSGIKLRRGYVYDRTDHPSAARVVSEMKNTEENGLGKPLPKGVVRLYAPDPDGIATYVSQTTIDHTPKGEKLRFKWGHAFDIVCSAKRASRTRNGNDWAEDWEYQIRNHKPHAVTVTVVIRVPRSTYQAECKGFDWRVREVGIVEVDVLVAPDEAKTIPFRFRWNPASGGGLTAANSRQ